MGGATAAASEVNMDLSKMRCMCCGMVGMVTATTTVVQQLDGVRVAVDGVPAMRCQACGEMTLDGKVMIPIDEAIEQIFLATGVATRPTAEEIAALREENRALARALGQEDTSLDDPTEVSAAEPSNAGTPA
jgi:YgiT-type zinc finger domain-containing protein